MNIKDIYKYLFASIVPSVIISFALNSIILVISTLVSISLLKNSIVKSFNLKYLLFNAFTLSIILGLIIDLISGNPIEFNELTKRFSFLVMPLIILAATPNIQKLGIKVYVYFTSCLSFFILVAGFVRSIFNRGQIIYGNWDSETTEKFYDSEMLINWGELSYKRLFLYFDMHPSYYALFSIISIIILLFMKTDWINRKMKGFFICIHVIMLVLISSKTGYISLILVLLIYFFTLKSLKKNLIGILALGLLTTVLLITPTSQIRLKKAYNSILLTEKDPNPSSTSERLLLWNSLKEIEFKKLLIGFGNEGGPEKTYANTGIALNMHNQFLQSLINSGVIGLLLLIIFVISPLIYLRNTFVFSLVLIVLINLMFENMLDRVWGIIGISFFYAFLLFGNSDLIKMEKNIEI